MMKTYKFRIYPTKKQEFKLIQTLTTCRFLYNDALAERKRQAELNKLEQNFQVFPWGKPQWLNKYDQQKRLTKTKTESQKKVYSQVLQDVISRVERAFKNFFRGFGYPRFQGRNRYDSFTYTQSGFKIENGKLKLSKIGEIRIFKHREIEGKIKTCTIKRDVDEWYACFSVEEEPKPLTKTDKSIGVDVGLKSLITLSNGKQVEPPQYYRKSERKLKRVNRWFSRKQKGSNNRNKFRLKLSRLYRTIKRQRLDFHHKLSRKLVDPYDKIVFEKLQIQNMVRNHHLAKSILDAGWYQLIQFTKYKAEWAGKVVKLVSPNRTSMTCCKCGHVQKMPLHKRTYNCEKCGNIMDRDHNAAVNIKNMYARTVWN